MIKQPKIYCQLYTPPKPVDPECCMDHFRNSDSRCHSCEYYQWLKGGREPVKKEIKEIEY